MTKQDKTGQYRSRHEFNRPYKLHIVSNDHISEEPSVKVDMNWQDHTGYNLKSRILSHRWVFYMADLRRLNMNWLDLTRWDVAIQYTGLEWNWQDLTGLSMNLLELTWIDSTGMDNTGYAGLVARIFLLWQDSTEPDRTILAIHRIDNHIYSLGEHITGLDITWHDWSGIDKTLQDYTGHDLTWHDRTWQDKRTIIIFQMSKSIW